MNRNSRPGDRPAADLPGSSPGGVRPVEEVDEQPLPPSPTVNAELRNELTWAEVVQTFAPDTQIHAQHLYDTYRRLDASRSALNNALAARRDTLEDLRDYCVNFRAFQLALRHVDATTVRIVRRFFTNSSRTVSPPRVIPQRIGVNEILDTLTATNLSSLLSEISQAEPSTSSIRCAICHEDYVESDVVIVLACHSSHHFHQICIRGWFQRLYPAPLTCPNCRALVGTTDPAVRNSPPPAATGPHRRNRTRHARN
ncbi:hypothetical protein PCANC_00989 [Puccinia coronata f. sp. avenae]|uniref:RING-type domain-containing protein n=1 Tax=Puccinia coronata f. sp. avenae TaxID=200324 RepID=A0A2N5W6J5_9BASI|nr:hypothetical protein PCANC_00989 [Puccinia coronata f. sp. avenae]